MATVTSGSPGLGRVRRQDLPWVLIKPIAGNNATAINAALSESNVFLLAGTYTTTETINVPEYTQLVGAGINASSIVISADVDGLLLAQHSRVRGFKVSKSGTHTKNGIEVGTASVSGGRSAIQDVWVDGMGNDGIQIINGNLGSIRDVVCTSNGRDGINFTIDTVNTNAWKLEGFNDLRANVRDGLHLAMGSSAGDASAPKSHSADLVVAQSNGRYGVYVGTRSNHIVAYCESNTTAQVFLDTYANGNEIKTVEGAVTDSSNKPESNIVQNFHSNSDYQRVFQNKTQFTGGTSKGFRIANNDGTAGYLDVEKTAAREIRHKCGGSGADWMMIWENVEPGFAVSGRFGGAWSPVTDNTYSVGISARRWGSAYINALILKPAASVTPAANGDLVFEATSDTSVTLKLKGSDGTVRSVVLTLA